MAFERTYIPHPAYIPQINLGAPTDAAPVPVQPSVLQIGNLFITLVQAKEQGQISNIEIARNLRPLPPDQYNLISSLFMRSKHANEFSDIIQKFVRLDELLGQGRVDEALSILKSGKKYLKENLIHGILQDSAPQAYKELFELILDRCNSEEVHQAFTWSLQSKNEEMMKSVLSKNPSFESFFYKSSGELQTQSALHVYAKALLSRSNILREPTPGELIALLKRLGGGNGFPGLFSKAFELGDGVLMEALIHNGFKTDLDNYLLLACKNFYQFRSNPEKKAHYKQCIFLLGQAGANVNVLDEQGVTPLYYAGICEDQDLVQWLLGLGADVNKGHRIFEYFLERYFSGLGNQASVMLPFVMKGANLMYYLHSPNAHKLNAEHIYDLVKMGADINAIGIDGDSLLSYVLTRYAGNILLVNFLIERGVDVNKGAPISVVLGLLAKKELIHNEEYYRDVLFLLLRANVSLNLSDITGEFPLQSVIRNELGKDMVELLLNHGADKNLGNPLPFEIALEKHLQNPANDTYLLLIKDANIIRAIQKLAPKYPNRINIDTIITFVKLGCDVDGLGEKSQSLFNAAILSPEINLFRLLTEEAADVNLGNPFPLHQVLSKQIGNPENRQEMFEIFLNEGADVNQLNDEQQTSLHVAIDNLADESCIAKLLEFGADVNKGYTKPFRLAQEKGRMDLLPLLVKGANVVWHFYNLQSLPILEDIRKYVEYGADLNATDKKGRTLLLCAIEQPPFDLDLINFLIEKGSDVNHCDMYGRTPLIIAFARKDEKLIRLLLNNKASIVPLLQYDNKRLFNEYNLLNLGDQTNFLLSLGADFKAQGQEDFSLLAFVISQLTNPQSQLGLIEFLIQNGAEVNAVGNNGISPLMGACDLFQRDPQASEELIKILISKGVNIDFPLPSTSPAAGGTVLHYAVLQGYQRLIDLFLDKGGNINVQNLHKENLIGFACKIKNEEIAIYLLERNANIFEKNKLGYTAVEYAISRNMINFIKILSKKLCLNFPRSETILQENGTKALMVYLTSTEGQTEVLEFAKQKTLNPAELYFVLGRTTQGCFRTSIAPQLTEDEFYGMIKNFIRKHQIPFNEILNLMASINLNHLKFCVENESMTEAPSEIKIESLITLFKEINFRNKNEQGYKNPQSLSDEGTKVTPSQLQRALKDLNKKVYAKTPYVGTPKKDTPELEIFYKKLHNFLRHLAVMISQVEDVDNRAAYLIDLALGARHCGIRWFNEARLIRDQIKRNGLLPMLQERYFMGMQQFRSEILMLLSGGEVHRNSQFIKLVGEELGIMGASDLSDVSDPLTDTFSSDALRIAFLSLYDPSECFKWTEEFLNESFKQQPEPVLEWFKSNIPESWEGYQRYREIEGELLSILNSQQQNQEIVNQISQLMKKFDIWMPIKSIEEGIEKGKVKEIINKAMLSNLTEEYLENEYWDNKNKKRNDKAIFHFGKELGVWNEVKPGFVAKIWNMGYANPKRKGEVNLEDSPTLRKKLRSPKNR